jgi:hypothetical protein
MVGIVSETNGYRQELEGEIIAACRGTE